MDKGDDKRAGQDSGPVVRPYALTGGRTEPATGEILDLVAIVVAAPGVADQGPAGLSPECRKILRLCRQPATVADVVADTALPLGVVRVLLADLLVQGRLKVAPPQADERPSANLLEEVLHGLRAL
jgi:uncharacterized protein DUF742